MDLLLTGGTVVTMNRERAVLAHADVLVQDGRIAKIGKNLKPKGARRVLDVTGKAVLPGLIHGHLHACQTLFRGRADGLELLDWLKQCIWPSEAAHDADSMRASADLTFAELIRSGATAALDMGSVHHYDAVFESARDSGFRLVGGKAMMDAGDEVPAGLRESTAESLAHSLALLERWHGTEGDRLRYAFAPRFVLSCSPELLREVARLSRELKVRIHTHASENSKEVEAVRQVTGQENVAYFQSLGITGPQSTLAHCVWLSAEEQAVLRETRTVVCHCPGSNLKLASGIARVPELLEDGIPVSLGSDGAACDNTLDIFHEMRLASVLHNPRVGPRAMTAMRVMEMATLHGARALGLEDEVGSLEPGKRADITVVDLSGLHTAPEPESVLSSIVYASRASDVSHVVIDGKLVLKDGVLTTLDAPAVIANARAQSALLTARLRKR
ncbi:5'-deoxyadenosine deaminase [Corallococcus sp. H22C18031201]|uniref:5'-deoxyadenosine deaminase n=1 Tax=Citreicoccus inhibens TaxID=2849499 RepID=UPI000E7236AE|nr:5'-deoxyadenosine deaminase [Citreicoccus inhibens]MBU8899311.1 5'-deoxyadenosine deaminase [Citreicoccus inhibens]RJS25787.1 5'-deoxyadenosine deaminase [Corallococcus sp. H22C18031201]